MIFGTRMTQIIQIRKICEIPITLRYLCVFMEMIIMKYDKKGFGKIKLTVGVLRSSLQKIQYCITAIENG
jgi:hypothetical protein